MIKARKKKDRAVILSGRPVLQKKRPSEGSKLVRLALSE